MEPEYRYKYEIGEGDPVAPQPAKIKTPLKPHQLASLHKAMVVEQTGKFYYYVENPDEYLNNNIDRRFFSHHRANYRNNYKVYTNVGILGDMVGYGKTLVALGIIASTPSQEIYTTTDAMYSYVGNNSKGNIRIECEMIESTNISEIFNTTLVVVPIGPVYVQWNNMLEEHTSLKYIAIKDLGYIKRNCPPKGSTSETLKAFFEQYDVVLIKHTTLDTLLDYYEGTLIRGFSRIMIDEAPDFLSKIPAFHYRFIWFISATYIQLITQNYRGNGIPMIPREVLSRERMYAIMVRCEEEFTKKSFSVPSYQENTYMCVAPAYMQIISPFLSTYAIQLINANDIAGAIRELGGTIETEDNIVNLVSKNLQREIFNKKREKEYFLVLDMNAEAKANKIRLIEEDLEKMHKKKADLEERISKSTKDACAICYDTLNSPVMLSCTHVFCGQCILKWIDVNNTVIDKVCPTCRTIINKKSIIAISNKKETSPPKKQIKKEYSKMERVIDIITKKPEGRFLIFSTYDYTFHELRNNLRTHGIMSCELKGATAVMMNNLESFKRGDVRVILLNTNYAGSGIDISCATDVIMFHHMGEISKQAIGRAQRVGRKDTLTVHWLLHPNEVNNSENSR